MRLLVCQLLAQKGSWLRGCHPGKERDDVQNRPLDDWEMQGKLLDFSGLPSCCMSSASILAVSDGKWAVWKEVLGQGFGLIQ